MIHRSNLIDEGQARVERCKKFKAKQLIQKQLQYSSKIDNYIPGDWDFDKYKLHDFKSELNNKTEMYGSKESILSFAIEADLDNMNDISEKLGQNIGSYIVRNAPNATLFIFKGKEEVAFQNILLKKAAIYSNSRELMKKLKIDHIPRIENGFIINEISPSIITGVMIHYDKHYAKLLLELYEAGKFTNQSHHPQ